MKLLLDRGVWIVIALIIVYIFTDLLWFQENSDKQIQKITAEHAQLMQKYNELNEQYSRVDYRADGNTQHIDSVHAKVNNLLVGDRLIDLSNEDHSESYDKLTSSGEYNNKDYSYFNQLDQIKLDFRKAQDNLDAISEKMVNLNDLTSKDLNQVKEDLTVALLRYKKLDNSITRLIDKVEKNSLILLDSRWKDIDIDELFREFNKN